MDISLVIPCYNSSGTIRSVLEEFKSAMKRRPALQYEIILVNDHSTDNTWCVLKELADENQEVICIDFAKNFGQPSALLAGFAVAQGDYILTSDDDGQCPVGEVFHFWEELQKGYDVVCAKYTARHPASGFRKIGTYINEWMARAILKKPDGLALASFFMAKKFVVERMLEYKNAYPYIAGLLLRTTTNIGNITLVQRARTSGESGYNYKKLLNLWLNGFTAFSVIPLRVASFLGIILSLFGALAIVITIINKMLHPLIPTGWSSLFATLLLIGGVILLMLGMIGEYIGRIYLCINQSPQYVIREVYSKRDKELSEDLQNDTKWRCS